MSCSLPGTREKGKRAASAAAELRKPEQSPADEVAREVLVADLELAPLPAVADLLQGGPCAQQLAVTPTRRANSRIRSCPGSVGIGLSVQKLDNT